MQLRNLNDSWCQIYISPFRRGSYAGPVLYLAYVSTIQNTGPDDVQVLGYPDDCAMKKSNYAYDRQEEIKANDSLVLCHVSEVMNGHE